jgi:hypothetical protein
MTDFSETLDSNPTRPVAGQSRGVALSVAVAAVALFVLAATPLLYLLLIGSSELAALAVDPAGAASLLERHKFPFREAAAASGRAALAGAFVFQTRLSALGLFAIGTYFAWRGYASPRSRGWSHLYWVSAVCLVFFAPTALPRLSVERADYAVTAVLGAEHAQRHLASKPRFLQAGVAPLKLYPAAVLASRAGFVALAAVLLGLACHDAAYRLREALAEFGLVEEESGKLETSGASTEKAEEKPRRAARSRSQEPGPEEQEGSPFGRRGRARKSCPQEDARSRALAALGLQVGASRAEIEKAFRARIKRAHPDHGGSVEQAAVLNMARDLLLPHG